MIPIQIFLKWKRYDLEYTSWCTSHQWASITIYNGFLNSCDVKIVEWCLFHRIALHHPIAALYLQNVLIAISIFNFSNLNEWVDWVSSVIGVTLRKCFGWMLFYFLQLTVREACLFLRKDGIWSVWSFSVLKEYFYIKDGFENIFTLIYLSNFRMNNIAMYTKNIY